MNDLISRQAAIDALGDEPEVWTGEDEYAQGLNNQWHYDRNAILGCPSAEPERKRGKWLMAGEDEREQIIWVECSECGQALSWKSNYCPNCGADMRGEQDETN